MSWAFSIGDFLITPAAAAAEIPARPQENGGAVGRSGGKYATTAKRASFVRTTSPAHKQREMVEWREELDWQRRWLRSRLPPNYRGSHLPEDRQTVRIGFGS